MDGKQGIGESYDLTPFLTGPGADGFVVAAVSEPASSNGNLPARNRVWWRGRHLLRDREPATHQ